VSLEVAGHAPWRAAFAELGLMTSVIGSESGDRPYMPDFLQRLRLSLGVDLARYLSVAGGVSWALVVTPEGRRPLTDGNPWQLGDSGDRLQQWPGAHLSVRIGTQ
jgi:hypothetical protein